MGRPINGGKSKTHVILLIGYDLKLILFYKENFALQIIVNLVTHYKGLGYFIFINPNFLSFVAGYISQVLVTVTHEIFHIVI